MKTTGQRKRPAATKKAPTKRRVPFQYFDPEATVVALVGDFNRWDPQVRPMKRDAGGLWKGQLLLAPGEYQYKFVINGHRWEEDPINQHRIPNEHGTHNSVCTVELASRLQAVARTQDEPHAEHGSPQ